MLKEIKAIRQIPGEPSRRWYKDQETDLIVWSEQYRVVGFQLMVPHGDDRVAITWHEGRSPTLSGLDDGEGCPGRPKMTPLLSDCGSVSLPRMVKELVVPPWGMTIPEEAT